MDEKLCRYIAQKIIDTFEGRRESLCEEVYEFEEYDPDDDAEGAHFEVSGELLAELVQVPLFIQTTLFSGELDEIKRDMEVDIKSGRFKG